MDIKQEITNTTRELEATVQKANELQSQAQALMQQCQLVLQEALKLEGELRALKRLSGAKPKGAQK
ncbi:hypothetical protein ES708_32947 [subsurface metagenome]